MPNKIFNPMIGARSKLLCTAVRIAMPIVFLSGNVSAQQLEEITVTARKVQESLQDVPVAVSVVNSETLEEYNLDDLTKLSSRIPTLQINSGGTGAGGSLTLRGIGNPFTSAAFEPSVAINIDGVPMSSMRLVQNAFIDLQQVEVLKGPQSVFFGKSATAGVMDLSTQDPGEEFEGKLSGAHEGEESRYLYEAVLSGPVTDELGARLVLAYQDADSIMENDAPGVANPERGEESLNARLTLAWDPADNLYVNFKSSLNDYKNDGLDTFAQVRCGEGENGNPGLLEYPSAIRVLTGTPLLQDPGYSCGDFQSDRIYRPDQYTVESVNSVNGNGGVPYSDMTTSLSRVLVEYDINEQTTLTSITGYLDMDSVAADNVSYGAPGGGYTAEATVLKNWTQEFRLSSALSGGLNYQLGLFLEDREFNQENEQTALGITAALALLNFPGFDNGADPVTGRTMDWHTSSEQEGKSWSAYGSVDYELSEQWTISGGLRYSYDERESTYKVLYMHSFLSASGLALPTGFESEKIEFDDSNVSGELAINYFYDENISFYAAYKTGYKSGGIDTSAFPLLSDIGTDPNGLIFESESGAGFELGMKSELLDNTLRLNGVAYYYVYEDLQNQQFNAVELRYKTFNAGEITSWGVEWDAVWATPIEGLNFTGAVAYLNAEFTDSFISETGEDLLDRTPKQSPEWTGNLGVTYSTDLGEKVILNLGANMSFSSSHFLSDQSIEDNKQGSYETFDLSMGVSSMDGVWNFSVFATNITDEIYSINSVDRPLGVPSATGAPLDTRESVNQGRLVTARLMYNF